MDKIDSLRSPYALRQLGVALAYDLKSLWLSLSGRLARTSRTAKIGMGVVAAIAILLPIYVASKPAIRAFLAQHNAAVPAKKPSRPTCLPAICTDLIIADSAGKKAIVQFRVPGEDSYWKRGSKDMIASPSQGEIPIGKALDALYAQKPFEGVKQVIAIGTASSGIKVSNKQEESLAGQRAAILLDQLRPKLAGVELYSLNLGRYAGNHDDKRQRLPITVSVFESDPDLNLEDALFGAIRAKQLFGLNLELFSKATSASLRADQPQR